MIKRFSTLFAGHVDLGDVGQDATPVNERRYTNEHLVSVFEKTEALARVMDDLRKIHRGALRGVLLPPCRLVGLQG